MNTDMLKKIKVLIVDDEIEITQILHCTLEHFFKELVIANDSKKALEIFLKEGDFDIVITDMQMPHMNGIELIREIRKHDHSFPVTIASAYTELDYLYEAINLGVNGYITKPFNMKILLETIKRVVEPRIMRKQLEHFNHDLLDELHSKTKELTTILNSQDTLIAVSTHEKIHTANNPFLELFQITTLDETNNNLSNLFNRFEKDENFFYCDSKDLTICLENIISTMDETFVKIKNKHGKIHIFKLQINTYKLHKSIHYVFSFTDVTNIKNTSDYYQHKAMHDGLTNLYNRQYMNDHLINEINRAKRFQNSFILAMMDIDHFKNINDTYGHDIGDEVLINLSNLIKKSLRQSDVFARWGGEEFLLFLPQTSISNAQEKLMQLKTLIEQTKLSTNVKETITISCGFSEFLNTDTKDILLKRVDVALYNAKKNGRNRIEIL